MKKRLINILNKVKEIPENLKKNKTTVMGLVILFLILLCVILPIYTYTQGIAKNISQSLIDSRLECDAEFQEISGKLEKINTEYKEQQEIYNDYISYKKAKETKDAELTQLDALIEEKNNNISTLDIDIAAKLIELDQLKNTIQRTGEEPKVLPAGEYTVGKDIPAGRYTVTGKSNFVVWSSFGDLKVNTILGGGRWGEESYTCTLSSGDKLELASKDTFTPIK